MKWVNETTDWIFDLDGTLYSLENVDFFDVHMKRMDEAIRAMLGLDAKEAATLRDALYESYGLTLRGLMELHGVDPVPFVRHVYGNADMSALQPSAELRDALSQLPGRLHVFSNSPRCWVEGALEQLGVSDMFDHIVTLEDVGYCPKPQAEAFRKFFEITGARAESSAFFEDSHRNLETAHHHFSMKKCILVHPAHADMKHEHVHHGVAGIIDFLRDAAAHLAPRILTTPALPVKGLRFG